MLAVLGVSWSAPVRAHQPHDVIDALGMSPDYPNDRLVLISMTAGIYSSPMRSTDGGVTFVRIIDGMDNSGIVTSFSYSPRFVDDGTVYLSSTKDGIYRSTDRGISWTKINGNLPNLEMRKVLAGLDANGHPFILAASLEGGLYRSNNGGLTWTLVSEITQAVTAFTTVRLSNGASVVLAGTLLGELWRSDDGALSFRRVLTSPSPMGIFAINLSPDFETDNTLALGTQTAGVLLSTDGGATFTEVNEGLTDRWVNDVRFSPDYANDRTLFACTFNLAVFRSTNGGQTWELNPKGIRYQDQYGGRGHFFDLAISPNFRNDNIVMLGAWEGFYLSTDRGSVWVEAETRPTSSVTGIGISPAYPGDLRLVMSRYGGGMQTSIDFGGTWKSTNVGILNPYVYDLALSPQFDSDNTAFGLHIGAVVISNDAGNTWRANRLLNDRDVFPKSLAVSRTFERDRTVFVGSRHDGVFRTTDGGDTWTQVFYIPGADIVQVDLAPNYLRTGRAMIGVVDLGVYVSLDRGETWQQANTGLDDTFRVRPRFSPSFATDGKVFAATNSGLYTAGIRKRWSKVNGPEEIRNGNIEFIEFSPNFDVDREMFASVRGRGLYRSTDAGESWTPLASDLFDAGYEVKLITFSPSYATDGTMIFASDASLWFSDDRGGTWTELRTGSVRYENYNQQVDFVENWQRRVDPLFSAGDARYSGVPGDVATLTFIGQSVTWLGVRAPALGIVDILLDGVRVATVDCYAADTEFDVPLFSIDGLDPAGRYVLDIVVLDERNPASRGYGTLIDAFDVTP